MLKVIRFIPVVFILVSSVSCSRQFEDNFMPDCSATSSRRISVKLTEDMADAVEKASFEGLDPLAVLGCDTSVYGNFERLYPDAGEMEQRHREAGLHRWYGISVHKTSLTKASESLLDIEGVSSVSVLPKVKKCSSFPFNDNLAFLQWGLYNTGSIPGYIDNRFTPGIDINVLPVWEKYTAGSPEVIVAVVDGGVYTHPDLKNVLIPGGENGSRNFVDKYRDNPYLIVPEIHATAVASIIASINDNEDWFCGVAGGNDGSGGVKILNCQILSSDDSDPDTTYSTDNIGEAIVWAADHGAVICNNSWGYEFEDGDEVPSKTPEYIAEAIDYFCKNAGIGPDGRQAGPMRGGLVVFASGNDAMDRSQPAMYEEVIAVGAVGPKGERAKYSNYGNWVDICAPGGNMQGYEWSLTDNSKYAMIAVPGIDEESIYLIEGTSMACPYVSGVAALMVSYFGGEGFTADKLREMLLRGADFSLVTERDKPVGPMLDAMGAFSANCADPCKPEEVSVRSAGNCLLFNWKVTGNDGEPTYACKAQVSLTSDFTDPEERVFVTADKKISDKVSFEFSGLEYDTEYYARIFGMGVDRNNLTEPSEVFLVKTGRDLPPELVCPLPDIIIEASVAPDPVRLDDYFSEPTGERLEYSVSIENSRPVSAEVRSGLLYLTYQDYGQTVITVTAKDFADNTVSGSFRSLSRESSKHPYDLYPVPVTDILNIRPGSAEPTSFRVAVTSLSGSVVFDSVLSGSAFSPARVDMSACGPGVYNVKISVDEATSYGKSIVKK